MLINGQYFRIDSIPLVRYQSVNVSTPFLLDNVNCRGSENSLLDCTHNGIGIHNCDVTQTAGILCEGK